MSEGERASASIIIQGDVRQRLSLLPDRSVHMMVTSPPYYGLRNYGTDPQIWGGDPDCQHEWGEVNPPGHRGSDTNPGPLQHDGNKNRENPTSQTCSKCGAWKGELGLEPTPEMFVEHLVMIFREGRRVLRDDGVIWVNMGDSYFGDSPPRKASAETFSKEWDPANTASRGGLRRSAARQGDFKPKDLMEIPSMLAAALRADGWYLRSRIPWIKRNALPSSVKDRPSSSIEYIFLLSKSKKYYYDYVATMQPSSESYNKDKRPGGVLRQCVNPNSKYPDEGQFKKRPPVHEEVADGIGAMISPDDVVPQKQDLCGNPTLVGFNARWEDPGTGLRYMRDSDFFFRTWQGLLHNENGEPMAFVVNPKGYKGAHFACWPARLVEPMILAGTSEAGVCSECGAPWVRTTEKNYIVHEKWFGEKQGARHSRGGQGVSYKELTGVETTGWLPSCSCNAGDPVPATVLDPFAGSGATGVACQHHNRNFIGIELKPDYCDLARKRLKENK